MRRICLILVLSFVVVPAANASDRSGSERAAAADGALAVTGASGTITVQGRGLIFGHFDQGTLMVIDYRPDDPGTALSVTGAKVKSLRGVAYYSGSDVRFLLPAGRYMVEVIATGINLSGVGRGFVWGTGFGTVDDGSFAVNGGKPLAITVGSVSQSFGARSS